MKTNKKKSAPKTSAVVKMEVIVDPAAAGSLALVQELNKFDGVWSLEESVCIVTGTEREITAITDQYPQAVMKVEVL